MNISEKKVLEKKIKFGTDGWRGVIGDDFTFNNLGKLAVRISEYISSRGNKVSIGYDNRFFSPEYASFVAAVLAENGVEVDLTDRPVPTPAVSFRVNRTDSNIGIMITASHNPARYNGIKIKEKYGGSARSELVNVIVESINKTEFISEYGRYSFTGKKNNWMSDYKSNISSVLPDSDLKVGIEYMNGTGYPSFKDILKEKSYKHFGLSTGRDPIFNGKHPEPIPANLKGLSKLVKDKRLDIGFGFDGDADRIAVIDENGSYFSMQRVLAVLAYNLLKNGRKGRIIKTVAGTTLVDKICEDFNSEVNIVPIGFKNICPEMIKGDVLVAGEESGGLGFGGYLPERDSQYSAARILKLMNDRGKLFGELWHEVKEKYGDSYYLREDFKISVTLSKIEILQKIKQKIESTKFTNTVRDISEIDGLRVNFKDGSWLLLRPSGTEPLLRLYAEASKKSAVEELIKKGRELVL